MSALLPVAVLAGCSDWLTGPKLSQTPNAPVVAGRDPLLVAVGVGQTIVQTGDLARTAAVWMDQMGGSDRQYLSIASYQFDEDAFAADWGAIYTGGGLVDERAIEEQALASGDSLYAGIAKVWEAMSMGTAADWWGDVPYSEAVNAKFPTPKLDPQQQVWAEVQASLDTAIDWLQCSASTCQGPVNGADLFYNDDAGNWLALAHTLKARYDLRVSGGSGVDATSLYTDALANAQAGISDPANDFISYQSTNSNEWNLWYQFMVIQRSGYISAGGYMVNLLQTTHDPRLTAYFSTNSSGEYIGAPAGGQPGDWSTLSDTRLAPDFRQPIVTYAENQLILAEAAFRLGQTAAALSAYNAERASQGVPPKAAITLNDIMTEKYIALFQTMEPWNDYKRTCLPNVDIAPGTALIPGRVFYPVSTERNANPNIPIPSKQPLTNWDQQHLCPKT